MGLFSTLKKSLTGSWADVDVRADDAVRGEPLTATVTVRVRDEAIDVNKVVVRLQCLEEIDIPDYRAGGAATAGRANGQAAPGSQAPGRSTLHVRASETLHSDEQTVAGARRLDAHSTHTFEATFRLPSGLPPTLEGRHAGFTWRVHAGVDMKGNDPDSGWQEITVR